ncbi:MAG TPA: LysM peptidoglycan-binding domain-containing protein [Terriglobia bacterium]|nr:LysM peptidoglycan-binding domain-containing protein [Terriglobia bacterium]
MSRWSRQHLLAAIFSILLGAGCSTRSVRPTSLVPTPPRPAVPEPPALLPSYRLPAPPDLAVIFPPQFDPVQEVIEEAQAAFERGQAEYKAGHLATAKLEFNRAIATILESPVKAGEDKRLQKEFDRLVALIYEYEVDALRQGDGFWEPQYQPAPIDQLQTLTFPENSERSQLVGNDPGGILHIPLVTNAQVESSIHYFTKGRGRATLEAALKRSGRYREMILRILKEEGVPQDLIYLAQVESGFEPRARSYASAVGMWQFLAWRGKEYDLDRTWWEDERMDPEKATRAAARHLRDLYNRFGDWYLAMAAYHCGPECVARGVERTGYADFWELSRRRMFGPQTRNYVPVIIALITIARNPEKYGIHDLELEPAWSFDTVTVTSPVDLRLVAEMTETTLENIRLLNPNLLRSTTPKVPEYTLRIPLGTRELFLKRIAMIPPEKRVFWRWHTVRYGESLSSIARQFKTSVKAIAEVNNIEPGEPLREAAELIIPVGNSGTLAASSPLAAPGERHIVQRGDTLGAIARRFNVTTEQLMDWNNLNGTVIRVGQSLLVAPQEALEATGADAASPAAPAAPSASRPRRIASTAAPQPAPAASRTTARAPSTDTGRLIHRVRKGESLSVIASSYNVSLRDLQRDNQHLGKVLQVGDPVYIPAAGQ